MFSDDQGASHILKVIEGVQLRAQSTVYAKKLFVHDRSQW